VRVNKFCPTEAVVNGTVEVRFANFYVFFFSDVVGILLPCNRCRTS